MAYPQIVKSVDGKPHHSGANVTGFISWQRLATQCGLLTEKEIQSGKKIVQFEADHTGIKFIIEG